MADIHAVTLASTDTVIPRRARVRGIYLVDSGTAGSVVLKDGGASGTTLLSIATPASATGTESIDIPGDGILFETDVHATMTNLASLTVFFE